MFSCTRRSHPLALTWVCVHPSTEAINKWLPSSILRPIALTPHCCTPLGCSALPRLLLFDLWPRLQVGAGGARCLVQSLTITIRGSLTPTVWQAWTMSSLLTADSLVSGNLSNMDLGEAFQGVPFKTAAGSKSLLAFSAHARPYFDPALILCSVNWYNGHALCVCLCVCVSLYHVWLVSISLGHTNYAKFMFSVCQLKVALRLPSFLRSSVHSLLILPLLPAYSVNTQLLVTVIQRKHSLWKDKN